MLAGIYNAGGGSARDLDAMSRLQQAADEAELIVRGPLAVAWRPGSSVSYGEADGITCLLDGRLYDPDRLATELGGGVTGDAELVALAYRRLGEKALLELRGRFAVVLWDGARNEGLLATDLLAVQPQFVRHGVGWVGFASEMRDLLEVLPSRPGPDPVNFVNWLGTGGECLSGRTPFEGIARSLPGHLVDLRPGAEESRQYWRPRYTGTAKGTRAEHVESLREQLDRSLRRRMSPRSSAVILSGGLDSSTITAVASQVTPPGAELHTYSTVFPDHPELDEGWKVRSLTAGLGIEPHAFELAPQGALWFGLKYARDWAFPLTGAGALIDAPLVAEAAADGVEVVFDGQAGDEVLGFSKYLISDRLRRGRLLGALKLAGRWPAGRPATRDEKRWIMKEIGIKGALPHGYERRPGRDLSGDAPPWVLPSLRTQLVEQQDAYAWKSRASGPRWWRYLSQVLTDMPHRQFRFDYIRHRAAAVGVKPESALYDFDLVDHVLRQPPELLFELEYSRPLAREAMRGLIADDVRLNNVKANFSMFCFDMLTGADAPGIESLLMAPDAELGAYADMEWVRDRWRNRPERGLTSTMAWGTQIWVLVAAECWLRAQADPSFVDDMLDRPDVLRPTIRPAIPAATGTFSSLAGSEERVYR